MEQERQELMSKVEMLASENEDLKTKNRALEMGYQALNRTTNALRGEYDAVRRRVAKLEKGAAEHTRWVMLNAVDKQRLAKLQELADEVDTAIQRGLIDRMACQGIVSKMEIARGGKDASGNRSG